MKKVLKLEVVNVDVDGNETKINSSTMDLEILQNVAALHGKDAVNDAILYAVNTTLNG